MPRAVKHSTPKDQRPQPSNGQQEARPTVHKMLRPPAVVLARGTSRAGLYADIGRGLYPRPVKIGPRAAGWPDSEVAAMQAAVIAGKSQEEIRQLVLELEAKRRLPRLGPDC